MNAENMSSSIMSPQKQIKKMVKWLFYSICSLEMTVSIRSVESTSSIIIHTTQNYKTHNIILELDRLRAMMFDKGLQPSDPSHNTS